MTTTYTYIRVLITLVALGVVADNFVLGDATGVFVLEVLAGDLAGVLTGDLVLAGVATFFGERTKTRRSFIRETSYPKAYRCYDESACLGFGVSENEHNRKIIATDNLSFDANLVNLPRV